MFYRVTITIPDTYVTTSYVLDDLEVANRIAEDFHERGATTSVEPDVYAYIWVKHPELRRNLRHVLTSNDRVGAKSMRLEAG